MLPFPLARAGWGEALSEFPQAVGMASRLRWVLGEAQRGGGGDTEGGLLGTAASVPSCAP